MRVLARNAVGPSVWAVHNGNRQSTTNRRKPDLDITLTTGGNPTSIWSDGATMWVADGTNVVHAYDLSSDPVIADSSKNLAGDSGTVNGGFRWVGSDGQTLWADPAGSAFTSTFNLPTACNVDANCVHAYDLTGLTRAPDKDFELDDAENHGPFWTDGTTMWVADENSGVVRAYELAADNPVDPSEELATPDPGGFTYSTGVWSDGSNLWVLRAAQGSGSANVRVLPLNGGSRTSDHQALDLALPNRNYSGLWSDKTTMWTIDTENNVVRAFLAVGAVANPPPFFGVGDDDGNLSVEFAEPTDATELAAIGFDTEPSDPSSDASLTLALGGPDAGLFEIDADGRVTPASTTTLDFEAPQDAGGDNVYNVTVTVSDGLNDEGDTDDEVDDTLTITITITNVESNPPPFFGVGDDDGNLSVEFAEPTDATELAAIGFDTEPSDPSSDASLTLALGGPDAGLFEIDADGRVTPASTTTLDFEAPQDAGGDNVYDVTVTVSDGLNDDGDPDSAVDDTLTATLTITNVEEAPGAITVDPVAPTIGAAITATVTDPDAVTLTNSTGQLASGTVTWEWQVADSATAADSAWATPPGTGHQTATYTPTTADGGRFLRVTATYTDGTGAYPDDAFVADAADTVQLVLQTAVAADSPPDAPTDLRLYAMAETTADQFTVQWTKPGGGQLFTRYAVQWRLAGQAPEAEWSAEVAGTGLGGLGIDGPDVFTSDPFVKLSSLHEPDSEYDVRVAAVNAEGRSPWLEGTFSTNRRLPDLDIDFPNSTNNDAATGIWSNGETIWVADSDDAMLYAYNLDTLQPDSTKNVTLPGIQNGVRDIWSDGQTPSGWCRATVCCWERAPGRV